jgi:hypothetical protein
MLYSKWNKNQRGYKKEIVFQCWTLHDIFDCDDIDTVMSQNEEKYHFIG